MTKFDGGAVRSTAEVQDSGVEPQEAAPVDPVTSPAQPIPFPSEPVVIPDYLENVYHWAYLSPIGRAVFDHPMVVHSILWGNMHRLTRAVVDEIEPGQSVLQPACVYGGFSNHLADAVGAKGHLLVTDVAPIQIAGARRKLGGVPQATVRLGDAARPPGGPFDVVACFFLLHEVPEDYKKAIVNGLLGAVAPTGKIVFVDYHRMRPLHPLKPIMHLVFDTLEPFAKELWRNEIKDYASDADRFTWTKETYFGGLYQKVVARPRKG
ncbi:MAG: class I SAM-dependent methyltransferase [Alphaproteobacteria bacterium]|nr:class I SAM-dependent methyltransferase [Alphaproteobacteria bacterium]